MFTFVIVFVLCVLIGGLVRILAVAWTILFRAIFTDKYDKHFHDNKELTVREKKMLWIMLAIWVLSIVFYAIFMKP